MSDAQKKPLTIGLIGAGEMGAAVGRRLHECGARVLTSLGGRTAASVDRVRGAALEIVDDDDSVVRHADFVLSIVPPGVAAEVAERMRVPLQRTQSLAIYVECNAIAPATAIRIAGLMGRTKFIDAGIIGGPPRTGTQDPAQGPRFYASGASAPLLIQLGAFGLDIAVLEGPVGAASGLKLVYAGLTKGLTALGAAMINAAARNGLDEALRLELARTQPDILRRLDNYVPQMLPKAHRWVAEMEQIAEFIGSAAEGASIYEGIARLYEALAAQVAMEANERGLLESLKKFCGKPRREAS